jgi:L,D-transpeptidase YcbB
VPVEYRRSGRAGHLTGMLAILLALGAWPDVTGAAPDAAQIVETLRRSIEQLQSTGRVTVAGQPVLSAQALPEIYEPRGFTLLWNDGENEEALLGEIAAVGGDGLDPADYHFGPLRVALERRAQDPHSAAAAVTVDLLLTDALVRLATHFHFGKLDPANGQPRWDMTRPIRGEPGAAVVARMATGRGLAIRLGDLRPVQPMYGRLKSVLARYRVIEQSGGWKTIPPGRLLQQGMEDPRVVLIRQRLAMTGDFPGIVVDSPSFEPALAEALRRYQARHHLEVDGMIGPASVRELNRPAKERIDQLRGNLERARWLLAEVRGRFLMLDPAGRQVVLMENSQPTVALPAEFAPAARDAAEFRAEMRFLVVHPDWVLPQRLVEAQVAPLARRAPAELVARGLQVFDSAGAEIDAARANWSRPAGLIVRQVPGPRSFLGAIRFPMPNTRHIFVHGGPSEGQALPGSIRLDDPAVLARALAGPPANWTTETLGAALASGTPRTLTLGAPVPVIYANWSAWVEVDGTVSFRAGHEERDAAVIAGLERRAGAR